MKCDSESLGLLLSDLCKFLHNPVVEIRVSDSETVNQLNEEVTLLKAENRKLASLYSSECHINMALQDLLREHGISYREIKR